jgi:hypothetical protein
MALTKKISTSFGIELDNAYLRVGSISGNKHHLDIAVHTFANKTMAAEGNSVIAVYKSSFTPTENGKSWVAQAYDHLKSLPEFAGATDC